MILQDYILQSAKILANHQIENPTRMMRLLVAHELKTSQENIIAHPDRVLEPAQIAHMNHSIERLMADEPLSRIIGQREFWGLDFTVTPDVLDPRADSETLIELALQYLPDKNGAYQFLDIGTGSGCLLAALLSEYPNATGIAIDLSLPALEVARANLTHLGLAKRSFFINGNLADCLGCSCDLIISNPPYIAFFEKDSLQNSVLNYDPHLALFGGVDGLDIYRAIAKLPDHLMGPDGKMVIEIGINQERQVQDLFKANGWFCLDRRADLSGIPRALIFNK